MPNKTAQYFLLFQSTANTAFNFMFILDVAAKLISIAVSFVTLSFVVIDKYNQMKKQAKLEALKQVPEIVAEIVPEKTGL